MPCPANAGIHGLGADKHPVSWSFRSRFAPCDPWALAFAGRTTIERLGSCFFLWIGRNPLKSPELDEEIQDNPSLFSWSRLV